MACATLTNIGLIYFLVSLACVGVGAVIVSNQVIASIVVPNDLLGTIIAATISARILGGYVHPCPNEYVIQQGDTGNITDPCILLI